MVRSIDVKRNVITFVSFLAMGALGAESWVSDQFKRCFPSVNAQATGIELSFKPGMQFGFETNGVRVGHSRDYTGVLIRYGDSAIFYAYNYNLRFEPLNTEGNKKKFRILDGTSMPNGPVERREATLLVQSEGGSGGGSVQFVNEVNYNVSNSYLFCVKATRNLEPNVYYEDYIDTNTLRLLQAQGYYLDIDSGKSQAQPAQQLMEAEVFEESQLVKGLVPVADEKEDISKRRESTVGGEATGHSERFLPVVFIVILLPVSWFFWKRHKR